MNETVTEDPFSSTTQFYNVTQSSQNETSDENQTKYSLTIRDGVNYLMNGMPEYSNVNDDYIPYVVTLLITRKSSEAKKRAEGRLSIMLIITHLITVFHLGFVVLANRVLRRLATGFTFFILLECIPVLLHLLMGFVVTYFNLPYKSKKSGPQTTISMIPPPTPGKTPQKSILKKGI
ncbi:unnamed protein product, partial [Mesorhabditis belari]|uniref:Uncharacterized protein n=1 Tax=Mesorhabditis belari TaxID=2138241 RepID=A0AAF3F7E1_9BILA